MEKNIWKSKFTQNIVSILIGVGSTVVSVFCAWVMMKVCSNLGEETTILGMELKRNLGGALLKISFVIGAGWIILKILDKMKEKPKIRGLIRITLLLFVIVIIPKYGNLKAQKTVIQYTCKVYHNDRKVDTIKVISNHKVSSNPSLKELKNLLKDNTVYQCEILKKDTIKNNL